MNTSAISTSSSVKSNNTRKGGGGGGGSAGRGGRSFGANDHSLDEVYKIQILKQIEDFSKSINSTLTFPPTLSSTERKYVHMLSFQFGLKSKSKGKEPNRYLVLQKKKVNEVSVVPMILKNETIEVLNKYFANNPIKPEEREMVVMDLTAKGNTSESSVVLQSNNKNKPMKERTPSSSTNSHQQKTTTSSSSTSNNNNNKPESKIKKIPVSQIIIKQRKSLPIYSQRQEILTMIQKNRVSIISGETGSGKSTQVVQYILEENPNAQIVCTQPRRLAAMSLACRVAEEMGEEDAGGTVGYAVRLDSVSSRDTKVLFCTTGVVLRSLCEGMQNSSILRGCDYLIIDEVHERDRNADFLLNFVREYVLLPQTTTKVILMSATMNVEKFKSYFTQPNRTGGINSCGETFVKGTLYPVRQFFLEEILNDTKYVENHLGLLTKSQLERQKIKPKAKEGEEEEEEVILFEKVTPRCPRCLIFKYSDAASFGKHIITCTGSFGVGDVESELNTTNASSIVLENAWEDVAPMATPSQREEEEQQPLEFAEASEEPIDPETLTIYSDYLLQQGMDNEVDLDLIVALLEHIERTCARYGGSFHHFTRGGQGDKEDKDASAILIFLPGWGEITRLVELLRGHAVFGNGKSYLVLPLHSGVSSAEQKKVFARPGRGCKKIICATNIAETSLTIEDVVFVIDSGVAKEKGYDPISKMSSLLPTFITRANALQRKGRAGRCRVGACFHLYSRVRFDRMALNQVPEMQRSPLEELCIYANSILDQRAPIKSFLLACLDPPAPLAVDNAIELLINLGVFDAQQRFTCLGRAVAGLPFNAKLGKALLMGVFLSSASHALTLCVSSGFRDVFSLPMFPHEKDRARMVKRNYCRGFDSARLESDFTGVLKAYSSFLFKRTDKNVSEAQLRGFCHANFLSFNVLSSLQDMRKQVDFALDRRFTRHARCDDRLNNGNRDNPALVDALVCMCTFPNLAVVEGAKGKARLRCAAESVKLHVGSSVSVPGEGGVLVFEELTRGVSSCTVRNVAGVDALTVALFSGYLQFEKKHPKGVEDEEEEEELLAQIDDEHVQVILTSGKGYVQINRWIRIEAPTKRIAEMIGVFRLRFELGFLNAIEKKNLDLYPFLVEQMKLVLNAQQ